MTIVKSFSGLAAASVGLTMMGSLAHAAPIGSFEFLISGSTNTPTMTLTNTSDALVQITNFNLTIGNTGYNFDGFNTTGSIAPTGGSGTPNAPDSNIGGGLRSDFIDIAYSGFDPTETSMWIVDVDVDSANTTVDYRDVLFNNGTSPNSVALVSFLYGGIIKTASVILPDAADASSYTFTGSVDFDAAEVPLPAALPLIIGGLGVLTVVARRRRVG